MGRASKNMHRNILSGKGKENHTSMPEHKVKPVTNVPMVKGKPAPLMKNASDPNC